MSVARAQKRHPTVSILGSTVDLEPLCAVLDRLDSWVQEPQETCRRIVVTGFHGLWEASRDASLRESLNSADLWVPDGIAPVWIARLRGHRGVERIPGAELMRGVFEQGRTRGYRHFFYGDTDAVLGKLEAAVETNWPGNVVAGCLSPPFRELTPEEAQGHIETINAARPHFLWVGLGMPKQEHWIHTHQAELRVPVVAGVGAAFAFLAGTVRRAPAWIGRAGLEWLYRLVKEPRKCWRRSLVDGPQFVFEVLREQGRRVRSG